MAGRTWILIALALVGGLIAWWAVADRRPVERNDAPVERGRALEPASAEAPPVDPAQPRAAESDLAERERVAEPEPLAREITHRFSGRVVDEMRRPVRGAQVELRVGDVVFPADPSDAGGRFTLEAGLAEVPLTGRAQVFARDASGRRGRGPAWYGAAREGELIERELGTLVLMETLALRVRVVDGEAPVADATVRVALGHDRSSLEEVATDARGEVVLEGLEPGPVHLTARAPGREGRVKVFVPDEASALVELTPLGDVTVLVVDAENGAAVAGAELEVSESYYVPAAVGRQDQVFMRGEYVTSDFGAERHFRTDEEGRALVDGLTSEAIYRLSVEARGYEGFPGRRSSGPRLKPGPEPLKVELAPLPLREVRWPIVADELLVPPDGTPLTLRFPPGSFGFGEDPALPGPARVEGAHVIVENVSGRANLYAETPDGGIARLWIDEQEVLGKEVSFRRVRQIEVIVHDPDGAPVEGARTIARNQGNNDLGPEVATDAEGRAVIGGLYGRLAEVYLLAEGEEGRGHVIGSVDLEAGDGRIEATLTPPLASRARLRVLLDGEPRLPARFRVFGRPTARVLEELPERGELVLEVSDVGPGDETKVSLHAAGFRVGTADLAFPVGGGEASAELALERGALLVAHVGMPDEGRVELKPQQLVEETGEWSTPRELGLFNGLSWPNGPDGSFVFEGLSPGSWRVVDERSKIASDAALLAVGESEVHVELELGGLEWVSGRVELDAPDELGRVRVLVLDAGTEPAVRFDGWREPVEGERLSGDAFRVRVPADREVELVAWHPWLAATGGVGRTSVHGGRDGVVLRLAAGDELRLPTPGVAGARGWLRIGRYAGEPEGAPLAWHAAPIEGGVARCGLPRGTWTLWIDPGEGFAPIVLREVEVAGVTELPAPALVPGSSIRLKILVPEGQAVPRVHASAWRQGEPSYGRQASSRDETELVVPGLGPGRFRVRANTVMDRRGLPEREVELDGVNDLELELDLR